MTGVGGCWALEDLCMPWVPMSCALNVVSLLLLLTLFGLGRYLGLGNNMWTTGEFPTSDQSDPAHSGLTP
jgi:hypothetical protein